MEIKYENGPYIGYVANAQVIFGEHLYIMLDPIKIKNKLVSLETDSSKGKE